MIKVSVFYPTSEGASFDMDYYLNKHMPLVASKLGGALKGASVDAGLGGGQPGEPPTYAAMGHMLFDSVEAFQNAFASVAGDILADIPNYCSVAPVIQISDVKL